MSNPQINKLSSEGLLKTIKDDIIKILERYSSPNNPLCSHEILGLSSLGTITAISKCAIDGSGGYSIPASWIGSVCAEMYNNKQINQVVKNCKYNNDDDEFWFI